MSRNTNTIAKKKLRNIINLTLDHLKTTINYKAIPKDAERIKRTTEKSLDADEKM